MVRGELINKLLASYGHDDEFKAIAEQIIEEENQKNNKVLAKSLRKALMAMNYKPSVKPLNTFLPVPHKANEFLELIPFDYQNGKDLILDGRNKAILAFIHKEFRKRDEIKKSSLPVTNKIIFCGPPGSGKTMTAQVFAHELGLPLYMLKLDAIISSYLGETASNLRKIFEFSQNTSCVLFIDEFDSLARSREDNSEHSELRRVVNNILLFIERMQPKGFLVAATNLDTILDNAIWRRFDEVLWFGLPDTKSISNFLNKKFKNVSKNFALDTYLSSLKDFSYADLERLSNQTIKRAIVDGRSEIEESDFELSLKDAKLRRLGFKKSFPK